MKNDITYEYRVFTNRLIDVEAMEVGKCTSKIIKELKSKDKVDGRFFHTSDTDEWFFCWGGELQKLNLKGDADVNAALAEVEKLISEANAAVADAKKTATEAKEAADAAKVAADNATSAAESIDNKADKTEVEAVTQAVELKADKTVVDALEQEISTKANQTIVDDLTQAVETKASKSELDEKADKSVVEDLVSDVALKADADVVNELSQVVENKANASDVQALSDKVDAIKLNDYALKAEIPSIEGLAKESFVREEIAKIEIPDVPTKVSELENDKNYLTKSEADATYAKIGSGSGSEGVDLDAYATKEYVGEQISKIEIPSLEGYVKEENLPNFEEFAKIGDIPSLEGYAKTEDIPSMENYYSKEEIDGKFDAINSVLGEALNITNTILA